MDWFRVHAKYTVHLASQPIAGTQKMAHLKKNSKQERFSQQIVEPGTFRINDWVLPKLSKYQVQHFFSDK